MTQRSCVRSGCPSICSAIRTLRSRPARSTRGSTTVSARSSTSPRPRCSCPSRPRPGPDRWTNGSVPTSTRWTNAGASGSPASGSYGPRRRSCSARGAGLDRTTTWARTHTRYLRERAAVASMLKNYGFLSLAWILPLAIGQALVRAISYLFSRRFDDAWQVVAAWGWNLAHLFGTGRRRARAQAVRAVPDRHVRQFMASVWIRFDQWSRHDDGDAAAGRHRCGPGSGRRGRTAHRLGPRTDVGAGAPRRGGVGAHGPGGRHVVPAPGDGLAARRRRARGVPVLAAWVLRGVRVRAATHRPRRDGAGYAGPPHARRLERDRVREPLAGAEGAAARTAGARIRSGATAPCRGSPSDGRPRSSGQRATG